MKIRELILQLRRCDPEATVYMLSDPEGNTAAPLMDVFEESEDLRPGVYLQPSDNSWVPSDEVELE